MRRTAPAAPRRPQAPRACRVPSSARHATRSAADAKPALLRRFYSGAAADRGSSIDLDMVEKLVKDGKTAIALDMFKDAPLKDPKVLRVKARAQKAGKLVGGALETYDQLTLLEPNAVDVWLARADCLLDLQRHNDAAESYEEALKLDNKCAEAWTARAMLASTPVEALIWLEHALTIDGANIDTLKCHAYTLRAVGRFLDAVERIDKVLVGNSTDVEALLLKAASFESANQFEDAYNTFSYVLSVDPQNEYATSRLPLLKSRMTIAKEAEDALREITKQVEEQPGDPLGWQRKATFLLGVLGRYDSDAFEQAYELSPQSALYFCKGALIEMLHATGRFTEALKWLERVTQLEPNSEKHQLDFANTLYRVGRFGDAVPFFDAVLKKEPKNTIALEGRNASIKMQQRMAVLRTQIAALVGPPSSTLLREAAADAAMAAENRGGRV